MAIKQYRPTSPGRRRGNVLDYLEITRTAPEKSLLLPVRRTGGRNNHGHLTRRHRGGGNKRMYRILDFKRDKDGVPARVASVEYDPNRSANVALLHYKDGEKRYIVAPLGLSVGQTLTSGPGSEPLVGNTLALSEVPVGLEIHNIELSPGRGGQICRSAGSVAQLTAREGEYAIVSLSSGELRKIHVRCRATIGRIGNTDHLSFKEVGIPGFTPIQDYTNYDVRLHHTNVDSAEYVRIDDLKQNAIVLASFAFHAAQRAERIPR